jgi:hypothetical protein
MRVNTLRTLDRVIIGIIAGSAVWLAGLFGFQGAGAASTSKLDIVDIGSDSVWNYDFTTKSVSSSNVDWPVTLIFRNNAEVDKVKNYFNDTWACAGDKYGRYFDNGDTFAWDADAGAKSRCTLLGDVYHMRVYADGDDRLYNTEFGYWVYGTTHIDHNEQLSGEWFGESEKSEEWWRDWAANERGWTICSDCQNMKNSEAYRAEGNHRWRNSGYATRVRVP